MIIKKYVCVLVLTVIAFFSLYAQQGGYRGPGLDVFTVEQAKKLRDDAPVKLQGKIERFIGDEKYIFTDATGSITIEIDDKLWKDLIVDENDLVEIIGELEKDFMRVEIDVSRIRKI